MTDVLELEGNPLLDAHRLLEERHHVRGAYSWVPINERREIQLRYSWAIPSEEAIEAIVEWGPVVEVGAGTGYWASLIKRAGGDVVAYDAHPPGSRVTYPECSPPAGPEEYVWHSAMDPFFEVREGIGEEVVANHADRTLLLVWPPYDDPMASRTAEAFYAAGGERLIFVGEVHGVTGDRTFLEMCGWVGSCPACDWDEEDGECRHPFHPRRWEQVDRIAIHCWSGLHDAMHRMRRL